MKDGVRSAHAVALPPPLPPGVGRFRQGVFASDSSLSGDASVEAVDETSDLTQKWAEASEHAAADAAGAADAQANDDGRVLTPPPQNLCVTVASRIPEMLAESMSLADEDAPPTPKR